MAKRKKGNLPWTLIGLAYLGLSPRIGERLYHPKLFQPLVSIDGDYGADIFSKISYRDVFFNSKNGKKLHGLHFAVEGSQTTVLLCHGNKGNMFDLGFLLRLLAEAGSSIFVFDYQGFGRSQGKPSIKRISEDALAAYDYLIENEDISPERLIVYGESLGAAVAGYVASNRAVGGIIFQSAFTNIRQISIENIPLLVIYPPILFPHPYFDNEAVLRKVECPVLILHGNKDVDVGIEHANRLFASAKEPRSLVILPNTAHDEIAQQDGVLFKQSVKQFLVRFKKETRAVVKPTA